MKPKLNNMKTLSLFACLFLLFSISSFGQVPRKVLHESFTGSNCGPCAPAGDSVMNVLHQNEHNYTIVKYPLGSDPYYTAEAVSRIGYYQGGGSYSIPYISVDGNHFKPNDVNGDGTFGPHPVGCTYCDTITGCPNWIGDNYSQTEFSQAYVVPAYLELDVSQSVSGQTVDIEIDIRAFDDFDSLPGAFNRLYVLIMENITYNNVGSNGQTEFHYVMKKMLPNQSGTVIGDLFDGDSLHYSLSYTFNGNYDPTTYYGNPVNHSIEHTVEEFSDLSVIAFVQNFVTKEVYQSEWTYVDPVITSLTKHSSNKNYEYVNISPNPTENILSVDYFIESEKNISISIYTLAGNLVMKKELGEQMPGTYYTRMDVSNYSKGIYLLKVETGNKTETKKIAVN